MPQQLAQLHRRQFEPLMGAHQLMGTGTSISLWRYLAMTPVDSRVATVHCLFSFPNVIIDGEFDISDVQ